MSFKIRDIDPQKISENLMDKYVDFIFKLHIEKNPKDPFPEKEILLKRMKVEDKKEIRIWKAVLSDKKDEMVARLILLYYNEGHYKFKENKHLLKVDIDFLKEVKGDEIVEKLLLTALETIKNNKLLTIIESCSTFQRVWEFWEKLGSKRSHEEGVNRLYIDEVNWDLMKEWINEGRARAQEEEIELLSFKECPEEIIDDYTVLVTDVLNFLPLGESAWSPSVIDPKNQRETEEKRKEIGFGWKVLVTKEKNGTLSGLTEIFHSTDTTHWAVQDLTGVQPDFRGRGLGKWMKAEMLFFIKENLPETIFIQTQNADFNAPMMSINNRMGFKRHQTEKCYKINLDELRKKLE